MPIARLSARSLASLHLLLSRAACLPIPSLSLFSDMEWVATGKRTAHCLVSATYQAGRTAKLGEHHFLFCWVSVSPTAFRLLSCRKYWSPNEALPFLRTATAIIPLHRLSSPLQSTEGRRSAAVIHLPSYSFVVSKAHLLTCRPPRPSVRPSGRFDNDCLPYRPIQLSPL